MMSIRIKEELRHAGVGLLLGLLGVGFGIFWAVYITVNHDQLHSRLAQAERASIEDKFIINSGAGHAGHDAAAGDYSHAGHASHSEGEAGNSNEGHAGHAAHGGHDMSGAAEDSDGQMDLVKKELAQIRTEIATRAAVQGHHSSPDMATAHERLAKAHVHAMGLGILAIAVSVLLAIVPASAKSKTFAAACVGTGGLFYPLAWILMGMRTTAMGAAGAQASVLPMVGLSVLLVGLGLLLAFIYTLRWLIRG